MLSNFYTPTVFKAFAKGDPITMSGLSGGERTLTMSLIQHCIVTDI